MVIGASDRGAIHPDESHRPVRFAGTGSRARLDGLKDCCRMDVERQWRRKPAGKKVARALSSEMTNNLGRNSTPSVRQVTGESWETRAPVVE